VDPLVNARWSPSRRIAGWCAVTVLALGAAVPEAHASTGSPEEAMQRFEEAERLYQIGEHRGAIEILRGLLADNDDPVLWYNLARAYEGAGEDESAIDAYERYLEGSPSARDREEVRERIAKLEARSHEPTPDLTPAPTPEPVAPPPVAERRRVPLFVPWVVFGVGGAGLATGGVFGILARRSEEQAAEAPSQREAQQIHDRARRRALAANISFAVGGAVAAAGLTWAIVATITHRGRSARVYPRGLGIAGRF
jgi:tetratricopeptide (TPR) repeat protein